jgi:hypothetical protein
MLNKIQKKLALLPLHSKFKGVNSKNQNDRLEILKAKCEQEIQETEERLRVLKAKRDSLVALWQESEKVANPASEPDKYANMGYTEAVFDAIKVLWAARKVGATPTEIKNHLIAHGFKHGGNFDTSVYIVLGRLCESGKVISCRTAGEFPRGFTGMPGRKIYKPK